MVIVVTYLSNDKEIINFKAKESEITPYPLCRGNISEDLDRRFIEKLD